ncbi:MAG: hypothetical protein U0836_04430 [Pirellulales bacterium]
MAKFSLRWLLISVSVIALLTLACLEPNYWWQFAIRSGTIISIAAAVTRIAVLGRNAPFAIGYAVCATLMIISMIRFYGGQGTSFDLMYDKEYADSLEGGENNYYGNLINLSAIVDCIITILVSSFSGLVSVLVCSLASRRGDLTK